MDGTAVLTSGELNQSSPALKLFNRPFLSHGIEVPIQLQHRFEWVHCVGIEGLAKRSGGARYARRLLNGRRTHQGGIGWLDRRGSCRLSCRRRIGGAGLLDALLTVVKDGLQAGVCGD